MDENNRASFPFQRLPNIPYPVPEYNPAPAHFPEGAAYPDQYANNGYPPPDPQPQACPTQLQAYPPQQHPPQGMPPQPQAGAEVRLPNIPYPVLEAEYNPAPAHFPEGAAYPDQYANNGYPPPDPLQPQACPPQLQEYPFQQQPPQEMPPQPPVRAEVRTPPDYYNTSFFFTILWCLLCAPYLLVCTIPAILFSMSGREAATAGDIETAKRKFQYSLYCNIASIVCAFLAYSGISTLGAVLKFFSE